MNEDDGRLIAEFMGWEISEHELPFRDYPLVSLPKKFRTIYGKDNAEPYFQVRISELIFDKSWDWLMPVVEKIESMGYGVTIYRKGCQINDSIPTPHHFRHSSKIEETYKAVVKFIKGKYS
jgi:hypothetical protein